MAGKAIDMAGQRYDRWMVIKRVDTKRGIARWLCRCDCGTVNVVWGNQLRNGTSRSCGCLQIERAAEMLSARNTANATHRRTHTVEWAAWSSMKDRCTNLNSQGWANYGGRGITVCDEWLHDFQAFYDHIGPRPTPKHSLDRIDNDGNYEPGNVRWATKLEQTRNRRQKSECIRGHSLTDPANVRVDPRSGNRICRECRRIRRAIHSESKAG